MDWIGQHAPAATQEGSEQAKQAKNFNKRREDHVEVQVSGGRIQSIFVTQNLIIWDILYVRTGAAKK